jgi:hypothetical protein
MVAAPGCGVPPAMAAAFAPPAGSVVMVPGWLAVPVPAAPATGWS